MLKSFFKEITIILLLLLAIIILLGILFYNYIPNSKIIPSKVQEYALEESIKKELDKEVKNPTYEEVVKTYQLDAIDMEKFENTNEYDKGKINPFKQYTEGNNDINNEENSGNINNMNPSKDNFLNTVGK